MSERSYTIVGTGALGGYYGARLRHGGATVRFLLHSDYDHVSAHGLRVESVHGDFSIASPEIYRLADDLPASDVVVVSLKTTANYLLPELLPAAAPPEATVLMMQNGLDIEAEAEAAAPGRTILGGLAFTVSCAALVFAAIAIFLRFATRRVGALDSLAANAYGIYIVHYVFVTWLQYWLLGTDLSAIAKAPLVFAGTLMLSWGLIAAIRRIPTVARII